MEPLQAGDPICVGVYRLTGRLGAGGMGRVFLGVSPGGRKVAVKLMLPEHSADWDFRQRFACEVAAARQVGGFHTAPVVDADPAADPPWMVTAYIPGPSLAEVARSGGPLDPSALRALGAGLAEGLAPSTPPGSSIATLSRAMSSWRRTVLGSSADGAAYIKDLTWRDWGTATATGTGTLEGDNCNPNCAEGHHTAYGATVTLSGLVPYGNGEQAYSVMAISVSEGPSRSETFSTGLVP